MQVSCARIECQKDLESKHLRIKGYWACAALCPNRKEVPEYIERAMQLNLSGHYWWDEKGLSLHD